MSTLVQGRLKGDKFRWLAGVVLISTQVDSIDYDDYDGDDPGRQSLLAKHWNSYGAAVDGGRENGLVGGLVWDSWDHEASPQRRLWSELLARWVLWQRAVGRQLFYSNWELRYRISQLFRSGYLAASAFYDLGRTFDPVDDRDLPDRRPGSDSWHQGVGAGLRIAVNKTFILALDLGWPRDPDLDGQEVKVYMGLDWLF
ncbi:MAG: BamA/TamA family outer membrane protein [Candidatus Marinimicrobia bacterium]|nr:BamA/TamA family outer membrane protein [Candidatus Neomarinimicrobiota bacterium]